MIVCKYKFDKSIYSNLIPIFNDGYTGYTVSDEIDSENENYIIRTIECDTLPARIGFGYNTSSFTLTRTEAESLLEVSEINVNVTNMNCMFANCTNLTSLDVSNFNTSNVTNMSYMFNACNNLTSLDVSNWDTSNVTSMSAMFQNCNNLTSLDVSNWDTSNVTTMHYMFNNCYKLTSLDLSNWDTSNVTNMTYMFGDCYVLTTLDVSNWDTSNVTNMSGIFDGCSNLTSLDVSNWDTSNVTNMCGMFHHCEKVQVLDVSNWNTSNATDMYAMFWNCNKLTSLDLSNFDISNVTNLGSIIGKCNNLIELNINNISINNSNINDDRLLLDNNNLSKLYCNDTITLSYLMNTLCDRTSATQGELVTTLELDEEILASLTAKNWIIKDLVAQYRFDANTYEDLIPEFNTEFSSDKYEIHDSVSEIVIDNIQWEIGTLNSENGENYDKNDRMRVKNYISVIPNVTYKEIRADRFSNVCWYDKDKKFISYEDGLTLTRTAPSNACFMRFFTTTERYSNVSISAKLITRSIESINGDLPTLMRFGKPWTSSEEDYSSNKESALLTILDLNSSTITDMGSMFHYCDNLSRVACNLDTSNVTNMELLFRKCNKLTTLDVSNWNTSNVTNMHGVFARCQSLTSLDVINWNTNNVTNMYGVFSECHSLTSLDVSNWNTSKVTDMHEMFYNCKSLTSLDVSNWNTSNVTSMSHMFSNCTNLTSLDVSNFDTSNVTNMRAMFTSCNNLISLDVSNFDTSNVTNMNNMFNGCKSLTSLDVSNWNTSNVTDMASMFNSCYVLTSLDVSNWDTSKVTNMYGMFYGCKSLTSLDVSNFNTSNVTNMASIFNSCNNLISLDVSNWDVSNVTNMYAIFWNCQKLPSLDLSRWKCQRLSGSIRSFVGCCHSMKTLQMPKFNINSTFNDISQLFLECTELVALDLSNFDTKGLDLTVEYNSIIFKGTHNLRYIRTNVINTINDITPILMDRTDKEQGILISDAEISEETLTTLATKNWTVVTSDSLIKVAEYVYDSNTWNSMIPEFNDDFVEYFIDDVEDENGLVTRVISSMGGSPTSINLGGQHLGNSVFTTYQNCLLSIEYLKIDSNITTLKGLCYHCENLAYINTEGWNTSNVTLMNTMFEDCYSLTSLDVSNWDTSKVINMFAMFTRCTNLTSLDLSNFNTSKVTNMEYMFSNCRNLTSLDVSNWDTSKVTSMNSIFSNTPLLANIGMLYCTPSTINTITSNLPTTHTQTIWVQDTDINKLTSIDGVEFKEYKENGCIINLNSPLLKGDRIEVVDGKLCHYHKMRSIVLDGSENWWMASSQPTDTTLINLYKSITGIKEDSHIICNIFKQEAKTKDGNIYKPTSSNEVNKNIHIVISKSKLIEPNANGFKQWLQSNPVIVIYELIEPYYEDITPIQSDIVLETYLESNLDIYTKLPIKTNVSYITNVPSLSTLSMRATEMKESDNIIANLTDMLDNEINE